MLVTSFHILVLQYMVSSLKAIDEDAAWGLHFLTNILSREFILWVLKLSKIEPIYCRYWGEMRSLRWGWVGWFIRIEI